MSLESVITKSLLEKSGMLEATSPQLSPEQEAIANLRNKFSTDTKAMNDAHSKGMEMSAAVENETEQSAIDSLRDKFDSKGLIHPENRGEFCHAVSRNEIGEFGTVNDFSMEKLQQWNNFYCGECNGLNCYRLVSGRDSTLLNGDLPKHSQIDVQTVSGNTMTAWTDGLGRAYHFYTENPRMADGVRDLTQQSKCCELKNGLASDDAGHLLAREFGGPAEQFNLTPMDSYTNRHGEWRLMERDIRNLEQAGHKVSDLNLIQNFEGDSKRPTGFDVSYKVDGELQQRYIDNTPTKH